MFNPKYYTLKINFSSILLVKNCTSYVKEVSIMVQKAVKNKNKYLPWACPGLW